MAAEIKNQNFLNTEVERHLIETTTCHGAWRIWNSQYPWFRRVMWFIVVAGCLTFMGFQLYESFSSFLQFQLKTSTSIDKQLELELPTITVCNTNLFINSQLSDMDIEIISNFVSGFQEAAFNFKYQHFEYKIITDDLKDEFLKIADKYWAIAEEFHKNESEILTKYGSKYSHIIRPFPTRA